jgi:hypothetical protein
VGKSSGTFRWREKKRMHSKEKIVPGKDPMTEPEPAEEREDFPKDGDEYLMGGIELHARIELEGKKPKIVFSYLPTIHNCTLPEEITELNTLLEGICRITVATFPDPDCFSRFYTALKRDGLTDRCWYQLKITVLPGDDDQMHERISDAIDPDLLHADPHVAHRAKKARAMLRRCMRESERGSEA